MSAAQILICMQIPLEVTTVKAFVMVRKDFQFCDTA